MNELIWSPRSVADLEEIRAFIEADSPAWAELTVRRLVAAVERLQQFPDSGRMVPERQSPVLREVISGNFRVVYRRGAARVEIVTVFRGVGRFKARFFRALAFSPERWPELEAALRTQHLTQPVESTMVRPFGESSTIRATLTGPGGKSSVVVSVWFRAQGATSPHLVTAYPGGEK